MSSAPDVLDLDSLLDPIKRVADLEDALRDMRDAFLVRFSPVACVPCCDWTPAEKLSVLAVANAGKLIGDPRWVGTPAEPPQFERMRTLIEADKRRLNKKHTEDHADVDAQG